MSILNGFQKNITIKESDNCNSCLSELVETGTKIVVAPCGHKFHAVCHKQWVTTQKVDSVFLSPENRKKDCPACRGSLESAQLFQRVEKMGSESRYVAVPTAMLPVLPPQAIVENYENALTPELARQMIETEVFIGSEIWDANVRTFNDVITYLQEIQRLNPELQQSAPLPTPVHTPRASRRSTSLMVVFGAITTVAVGVFASFARRG